MYLVFRFGYLVFDLEYDFILKFDFVFLFLWYGLGEDFIWIYYVFLFEWFMSDKNKGKFYYIKK